MSTAQINQIIMQLDRVIVLLGLLTARDLAPYHKYGSPATLQMIKDFTDAAVNNIQRKEAGE